LKELLEKFKTLSWPVVIRPENKSSIFELGVGLWQLKLWVWY